VLDSLTDILTSANAEAVLGIEKYIRAVNPSHNLSQTETLQAKPLKVFCFIRCTIQYMHESVVFVNAVPLLDLDTFRFTDKQGLSVGSMSWRTYPYWQRLTS